MSSARIALARAGLVGGSVALMTAAVAWLLSLAPFASPRWLPQTDLLALSQTAPAALLTLWLVLGCAGAATLLGRSSQVGSSLLTAGGLLTALSLLAFCVASLDGPFDSPRSAALLFDAALPQRLAAPWTLAVWGLALRVAHSLGARPSNRGVAALLVISCARLALAPMGSATSSDVPFSQDLLPALEVLEGLTLIALLRPALAARSADSPARLLLAGAVSWLVCGVGLTLLDTFGNPVATALELGQARSTALGAGAQTLIVVAALAQDGRLVLARDPSLARRVKVARRLLTAGLSSVIVLLIAAGSLETLAIARDGLAPATAREIARPLWLATMLAGVVAAVGLTLLSRTAVRSALAGSLATNPTVPPVTRSAPSHSGGTAVPLLRGVALIVVVLILPAWQARTGHVPLPNAVLTQLPPLDNEAPELLRRGQDIFVREGCWSCHLADQSPSSRGPDLLTQGTQRSVGWQRMHLFDPGLARAWSTMPASPHLFFAGLDDDTPADDVLIDERRFDGLTFDGGGDATLDLLDEGVVPIADQDAEALVAWLVWLQQRPPRRDVDDAGLVPLGEHWFGPDDLFRGFCSTCHGTEGNGDGPAAVFLSGESLPRHLRKGLYRIRSHPELPTDADLLRTLLRGMPGSAMPGFPQLTEDDRVALVRYVKRLARVRLPDGTLEDPFTVDGPIVAQPVPPAPHPSEPLLARGAELVQLLGCARCHGQELTGMTAQEGGFSDWVDEAGRPLPRSQNLLSDPFKGGDAPTDLYRTLFIGQGGSPMPSYGDALPDTNDRWAVVLYLEALRQTARQGN